MTPRLRLALPALLAVAASALGIHALASAPRPAPTSATIAPAPVIRVVADAPAAPTAAAPARRSATATPLPAADRRGAGIPNALPAYTPPDPGPDACESQAVAHPTGFTQMGGSGTDSITDHGTTTDYTVYQRHAPLQYVCTGPAPGGGVEVDAILQPVGADADVYVFDMSPAGVTLVSITAGRAGQGAQPLTVDRRLGAWPTGGCGSVSAPGIEDTFCFATDGTLRHADLHERSSFQAISRRLDASLDAFPRG